MPGNNVAMSVELGGEGYVSYAKGIGRYCQICLVSGEISHAHNIA